MEKAREGTCGEREQQVCVKANVTWCLPEFMLHRHSLAFWQFHMHKHQWNHTSSGTVDSNTYITCHTWFYVWPKPTRKKNLARNLSKWNSGSRSFSLLVLCLGYENVNRYLHLSAIVAIEFLAHHFYSKANIPSAPGKRRYPWGINENIVTYSLNTPFYIWSKSRPWCVPNEYCQMMEWISRVNIRDGIFQLHSVVFSSCSLYIHRSYRRGTIFHHHHCLSLLCFSALNLVNHIHWMHDLLHVWNGM